MHIHNTVKLASIISSMIGAFYQQCWHSIIMSIIHQCLLQSCEICVRVKRGREFWYVFSHKWHWGRMSEHVLYLFFILVVQTFKAPALNRQYKRRPCDCSNPLNPFPSLPPSWHHSHDKLYMYQNFLSSHVRKVIKIWTVAKAYNEELVNPIKHCGNHGNHSKCLPNTLPLPRRQRLIWWLIVWWEIAWFICVPNSTQILAIFTS